LPRDVLIEARRPENLAKREYSEKWLRDEVVVTPIGKLDLGLQINKTREIIPY
jgi:hypothetical protein